MEVVDEYTLAGFDSTAPGVCQINVTFENCSAAFTVIVIEPEPIPEPVVPEPEPKPTPIDPNPDNPEDDNEELMNKVMKFFKQLIEALIALFKKEVK
jgi:hypothetical protein